MEKKKKVNINRHLFISMFLLVGMTILSITFIGKSYPAGTYPWYYPTVIFSQMFIFLALGFGAGLHTRKEEKEKNEKMFLTITAHKDEAAEIWVSYNPDLDLYSQGNTEEEALEALKLGIDTHLKLCHERGILPNVTKNAIKKKEDEEHD